jgi:predicted small metal-binding protein
MKTMQCKDLGGACDLEFNAETFDEIAQQSQQHGKEMLENNDQDHLNAMSKMKELMSTPENMAKWMTDAKMRFEATPDNS